MKVVDHILFGLIDIHFRLNIILKLFKLSQLLLEAVQQFKHRMAEVQLVHVNLHALQRGVHRELELL